MLKRLKLSNLLMNMMYAITTHLKRKPCMLSRWRQNILLESDKNENYAAELSSPIASSPKSSTLPMSPPLSSHVGGDENEYTDDSSNSEYYEDDENAEDETVNVEEVEILEGENGGRPRNSRTEFSDEKDCRPVKLSFRRGKVVDIQSENNSARKLKFRRGRLLGAKMLRASGEPLRRENLMVQSMKTNLVGKKLF
ncbi:hypothetical protein F3Y22_tig00117017pilonHSYRG00177 [Hibiscus syriacus]|uniref:Uncharacterized protein n=1 Tax=Hibiscus syriacus TaxID=106335 RepID=A0A6A2XPG6_HIBSY|nr:hypothetical protein F3Y22_tig00117017pilonHSYRG00177 [Hibiscus syriacus]